LDSYGKKLKELQTDGKLSVQTLLNYVQNEYDRQIAEDKYIKNRQEILSNLVPFTLETNSNSYKSHTNYNSPTIHKGFTISDDLSVVDSNFNKNLNKNSLETSEHPIENTKMVDQRFTNGSPKVDQWLTNGQPTDVHQNFTTSTNLSVEEQKLVNPEIIESSPMVDQRFTTYTNKSVMESKLDNESESVKFIRNLINPKKGQKYKSRNGGTPFVMINNDKVEVYKCKSHFKNGRQLRNCIISEVGQEFQTKNGLLISITSEEIPIIQRKFIYNDEKLEERFNNLINF
jgi:hypothetical protein